LGFTSKIITSYYYCR